MVKEVITILLIVGLSTIFIMSSVDNTTTGAVSSEMAKLRVERIELYHAFPTPLRNPIHKQLAERVRRFLLAGAHQNFYQYDRLRNGNLFMDNERELYTHLFYLMCVLQPEEFLPSKQINGRVDSIGKIPCDLGLQAHAKRTFLALLEIDYQLLVHTVHDSQCPELAEESMMLALQNKALGKYDSYLSNLRMAWSRASTCT